MPILRALQELLDREHIPYEVFEHYPAYTAQRTAENQHTPGRQTCKVVMVKREGKAVMLVLPADLRVDFDRLRRVWDHEAELESEPEFQRLFPGCEVGGEPPFGGLFGLETWVDALLAENEHIVLNAGSHDTSIKMRYADYARLARPRVAAFAAEPQPA